MPLPFKLDWKNPDYQQVFEWRIENLKRLRADIAADPMALSRIHGYYKLNPVHFIEDWGMTFDPRNAGTDIPAAMPFILFPRQEDWLYWTLERIQNKEPGVTKKSRDVGISWLAVGLSSTLCNFNRDMVIGFGSRKEEYVDKAGAPKSLFYKARKFITLMPPEFRNGWNEKQHSTHMKITFPMTNSVMTGEAGDNIGRGDRARAYFVDESAHLERPMLTEASLSATTDSRQDMSSMNGSDNPFAEKCNNGKIHVFIFHWRDDPRKDDAWYLKKQEELDPVTLAQEIDMDENASKSGIVIPSEWVQAAVDAHVKLNIKPVGEKRGALDVADEGIDKNAYVGMHGIVITCIEGWTGKESDIFETTKKAFDLSVQNGIKKFRFDSNGVGSGCRGDARIINDERKKEGKPEIEVTPWLGQGEIVDPEKPVNEDDNEKDAVKNEDFFLNAKSQAWWNLRILFRNTYRAVNGMDYDPNKIISISTECTEWRALVVELSQATYSKNSSGLVLINKKPDGAKSPNYADGLVILKAPMKVKPRGFFDL